MALVWFVDKFPRSRKPVQYRRLDDIVSFYSQVDRLERQNETTSNIREKHFKVLIFIVFLILAKTFFYNKWYRIMVFSNVLTSSISNSLCFLITKTTIDTTIDTNHIFKVREVEYFSFLVFLSPDIRLEKLEKN